MTDHSGLFTIGQFAALHGVNKKTLMWYDQAGIFRPAVVRDNGYRYYAYYQSATLETILLLRELDVPIRKIQAFLENRSAESLKALLEEQTAELDRRMAQLRAIRKALLQQTSDAAALTEMELSRIRIVRQKPEVLIPLPTARNRTWEQDTRTLMDEIRRRSLKNLYRVRCGAMIPVLSLYRGDFSDYRAVFLNVPDAVGQKGLHAKPGGQYLTVCYRGDVDDLSERYRELLEYADRTGLEFTGWAYETVLGSMAANAPEEYITRVELLLKEAPAR